MTNEDHANVFVEEAKGKQVIELNDFRNIEPSKEVGYLAFVLQQLLKRHGIRFKKTVSAIVKY